MPHYAQPLVDYLQQLQQRGQTHVSIDDDARSILREFYKNATQQRTSPIRTKNNVAQATQAKPKATATAAPQSAQQFAAKQPPKPSPESAAAVTSGSALTLEGTTPQEQIDSLRRQAAKWQPAKELGTLRQTMVFSAGNPHADVMLVGEAPGFDEERLQEPFMGKAGQKLDGILSAMGIERKDCYISHIVKFRPAMQNQTTNNRKPTDEEMAAFMPFIEQEVNIVRPKVIIALGGTAAEGLLDRKESVTAMRGSFHSYQNTPLRVTYHPSYILHNEATSEKRKLWEDMLEVMQLLNIPISTKQQSFFLPKT